MAAAGCRAVGAAPRYGQTPAGIASPTGARFVRRDGSANLTIVLAVRWSRSTCQEQLLMSSAYICSILLRGLMAAEILRRSSSNCSADSVAKTNGEIFRNKLTRFTFVPYGLEFAPFTTTLPIAVDRFLKIAALREMLSAALPPLLE